MIEVLSESTKYTVRNRAPLHTRWIRRFRYATPLVVWLGAIAAAVAIFDRAVGRGELNGYAEDALVTLAHLEPGIVRSVHVQIYEDVVPGQLLVTMNDDLERARLAAVEEDVRRLRAEVVAQRARLEAENTVAAADMTDLLRRAELDRDVAHVDYLAQLMIDARDRVLLRGMKIEHDIVRELHDVDHAPFRELNDIETRVASLDASLTENERVLERKRAAYQEADLRLTTAEMHAFRPMTDDDLLTPHRLAIQVRQRELEEIIARVDSHVLRAPQEGQVVSLFARPGDRVQPGAPLVLVTLHSTQRVTAYLPENMIHFVRPGANVTVNRLAAGALRPTLEGTVVDVSAAVIEAPPRFRPIPNIPVWGRGVAISLVDSDMMLVPGEAVVISFLE